jgi:amino-acid N-acetyltransferase
MAAGDVEVRAAVPGDAQEIRRLLEASGLPVADLQPGRQEFIVACRGGRVVGCAGAEHHGADALLRSLAVDPEVRGQGIGDLLLRRGVEEARRRGARDLYALTTTIEPLLARRGFTRVDRGEVPETLRRSTEFASVCPASAACMRLAGARDVGRSGTLER